ncbi:LOW QUALITY PROTEIN: calmodulin-binding transcription activator 2-like [Liolophura sinensis]|uniref:LOW QUALITY PROTEIN: calmodulin-binding transcription activator 2-like n=1 Tax=Liolophura sinensis TaxID=3198878 RepID=UPI003158EB86
MEETKASTTQESMRIQLPKALQDLPLAKELCSSKQSWNSNEEIASLLIAFEKHKEWKQREIRIRPPSGSMLLYSRNKVRYRKDGYSWKKRKDGKTIREDHMKLKVQGVECIYGSYVHSAVLPTFHRRCYWLLQNPDIVLVHYLNVPYTDNTKLTIPTLSYYMEKKEWTKEELVDQLRPMFYTGREPNQGNEQSAEETIAVIVKQLLDHQEKHMKSKLHKCDALCDKNCSLRRITPKRENSLTGSVVNSRLVSILHQNPQHSQTVSSAQVCPSTNGIVMAPSSTQPVATVTTLSDQVPTAGTPLILNLSNFQGSNGIIIVSGQSNTPISIINSAPTQEPPINSTGQLQVSGPMTTSPKHPADVQVVKGQVETSGNVPMQIGSSSDDLDSVGPALAGKVDPVSLFGTTDFVLPQGVLHTSFSTDLSGTQSDLAVSTADHSCTSGIASSTCDAFKSELPFPSTSDLSLDNFDLLDFADMDKLCPGWSDTCADVATDTIPQSSFPMVADDKPASLLGSATCLPNQSMAQQQASAQVHPPHQNHASLHIHAPSQLQLEEASHHQHIAPQSSLTLRRTPLHDAHLQAVQLSGQSNLFAQPHITPEQANPDQQQEQQLHTSSCQSLQPHPHILQAEPTSLCQGLANAHQQPKDNVVHSAVNIKEEGEGSCVKLGKGDNLVTITDFSPDWSYAEGGTKVLVTGPWLTASSNYYCLFDNKSIAATLVQPGVLRCFAPAHAPGLVTLRVAMGDGVISNSVVFEYKRSEKRESTPAHGDWFSIDESQLQLMLLDRFEQLEKRLGSSCSSKEAPGPSELPEKPTDSEAQLMRYCNFLRVRPWLTSDPIPKLGITGGTLLHLAAALGYHKLIDQLIKWRSESGSAVLSAEVDAQDLDNFSATPLMWACARGHVDCALFLYHWSSEAVKLCNKAGQSASDVARENGHLHLADLLDSLEQDTIMQTDSAQLGLDGSLPGLASFILDSPPKEDSCPLPQKPVIAPHPQTSYEASPGTSAPLTSLHIDIPAPAPYHAQSKLVRRFSEQSGTSMLRRRLNKRFSMEVFPDSTLTDSDFCSNQDMTAPQSLRIANSEPDLGANVNALSGGDNPMISEHCPEATSPDLFLHTDSLLGIHRLADPDDTVFSMGTRGFPLLTSQQVSSGNQVVAMDTDEISSVRSDSPFIDVEKVSSDDDEIPHLVDQAANLGEGTSADGQNQMVTLANQIIAAMPERIKSSPSCCDEGVVTECHRGRSESHSSITSQSSPPASLYGDDSGISTPLGEGLSFEDYRYRDIDTPASSLSPDSTCLPSPYSPYNFQLDSPPPTTADFNEYFNAPTTYMEKDFSQLTLSDHEQRKLYEAAKLIQNAFRIYRDKQQQQQQLQKEIEAAILIQSYYRRYKQYIYYKKMTQAAVLIQSQFRSYSAQKRYKKSRDAAVVIQNQYRTYKQHERFKKSRNAAVIIQQRFRNHYQRKQNQEMASNLLQMASESNDNSPVRDANTSARDGTPAADTESKKTTKTSEAAKKKTPSLLRSSSTGKAKSSLKLDPDLKRPGAKPDSQKSSLSKGDNAELSKPVRRASSLSKT